MLRSHADAGLKVVRNGRREWTVYLDGTETLLATGTTRSGAVRKANIARWRRKNPTMSDHPTEDEDRTFNIIRFYSDDRDSKIIKTGLTREEAMEWCSRDDTHKVGEWFDGFRDTALDEA